MDKDTRYSETLENKQGIIGYWPELDKYAITFSNTNTFDTQFTCILNGDMPENFRKQGLRVIFSGTIYRDSETPLPRLGGEEVFWVSLQTIHEE